MAVSLVQKRFMSSALKKWAYNLSRFNQYGLMRDDVLEETDEVKEALRRIPQEVVDARNYRLLRAMQLTIEKSVLPKNQWTKYEDDVLYLRPALEQVQREKEEEIEWNKTH